jgi:hypothetical protein
LLRLAQAGTVAYISRVDTSGDAVFLLGERESVLP